MRTQADFMPALPAGWERTQLRRVLEIKNGRDYKDVEVPEGGYPVYGSGGEFRRASKFLHDGESILFGRKGTIDKPLYVNGKFWTVDTMFYAIPGERVSAKYIYYFATTVPYEYYVTSTALPSMTQGDLAGHSVALPPLEEQQAIADYLDRETQRIDEMIAEQSGLIDALRERRFAVVEKAVTQGVRGAELSDSRIEWAQHVPLHWGLARIKYDASVRAGGTPDTNVEDFWTDPDQCDATPWVAISDMSGRDYVASTAKALTPEGIASKRLKVGPAGTVLLAMYASVGEVSKLTIDATWNQAILGLTPGERLNSSYLAYALEAMQNFMMGEVRTNTQANLNATQVGDMWLPCPPIAEQLEIVQHLDAEIKRADALIAESEDLIALSQERRAALITAAVTGQIDVRVAA